MSRQREFCDVCIATVSVYQLHGNIVCENCDRPLFDRDGHEIVTPIQRETR